MYEATRSAKALGLLAICYSAPILAGGLVAGWLLDRFDRSRVMLVDNVVRGAVIGMLPLLHALGRLEVAHAYAAAAVYGSLMMISLAGSPALVPSLVPRELLPTANALETLSFTLSGIVGPPVAGLMAARVGASNVLVVDAASYLAFVVALAGLRPRGAGATPPPPTPRAASSTRDGFLFVARDPILRSTTAMYMVANVGEGLRQVWLPLFAVGALGGGSTLYGVLVGACAVGEVTSSIAAGAVALPVPLGAAICGALVAAGLSVTALAVAPGRWAAAIALAGFGFFTAPLTIWAQTLRMRIIPEEFRGRVFALLRTMMQGATPLGGAIGGWLVPVVGVGPAILLTGACLVVSGAAGGLLGELRHAGPPSR
ncbi:MAG: MFS transporter [bacterium]